MRAGVSFCCLVLGWQRTVFITAVLAKTAACRVNESGESGKTLKHALKEAKMLDRLDYRYLSHCETLVAVVIF